MQHQQTTIHNVTEATIEDLIRGGKYISILRSGLYHRVGHCIETILQILAEADHSKEIRVILPNLANPDVHVRARAIGKNYTGMTDQLRQWQEAFQEASEKVAPYHSLQLRTTMRPHRYHAFLSEKEAIVGYAWHHRAALSTTSFYFDSGNPFVSWVIDHFGPDFDWLWDDSQPYASGETAKIKGYPGPGDGMHRDILQEIGKALESSMKILSFLRHYPDASGNGATAGQLASQFDSDSTSDTSSDWNKRLIDLEDLGLVKFVRNVNGSRNHGRILTGVGRMMLNRSQHLMSPALCLAK